VDVWSSRNAGNSVSKYEEGNLLSFQEVNEGNTFWTVWMKPDIHPLPVIETPTIVNIRLSKRRCW
jgi:hypothetical protein